MDNKGKTKLPRCPKGSRRNPKTKRCNKIKETKSASVTRKRCPDSTRKNPKTGECEIQPSKPNVTVPVVPITTSLPSPLARLTQPQIPQDVLAKMSLPTLKLTPPQVSKSVRKRCPKGTRKNKKTGECEPHTRPSVVMAKPVPDPVMAKPDPVMTQPVPVMTQPVPVMTQPVPVMAQTVTKLPSPRSPQPVKQKRCPKGTRKNKKTGKCEPYAKAPAKAPAKAQPSSVKAPAKAQTEMPPKIISIRSPENQLSQQVESLIMKGVPSYSPEVNKLIVRSLMRETSTDQQKYVSDCISAKTLKMKIENYPAIYVPKINTCLLQNDKSGLAKEALIQDLGVTSAKRIDPTKVIAPQQRLANCWFNTFFMCFFVSDKGRKFFRFFRELMITGERIVLENGKHVRKKINKPTILKALAWLNLGISASINGDPIARVFDTNKIIERLSTAGIEYPKVKKYGNPIRAYTYLTRFLYPAGSSSARTKLGFMRIDMDFKGISFEDNIQNERKFLEPSKKTPDVLIVDFYGKRPNSGELIKKTEFIMPETDVKYVLDSIVVRDLTANHFCCVVTINGEEWGFDGASFNKLDRFEWKKLINSDTQWTFDDLKAMEYVGDQPSFFSFNPTEKMLKKHKPTKKGEYNPPHTIYFYYRQN